MFAADEAPCPSCGARLAGRSGCQAVFEGLAARAWSTRTGQTIPSRGAMTIANLSAPQQSGSIRRSFGDGQTTFGWRAVFSLRWRVNGWMPSAVTAAPERQIGELLMTRSRRRRLATVGVLLMAAPALHAFQLARVPAQIGWAATALRGPAACRAERLRPLKRVASVDRGTRQRPAILLRAGLGRSASGVPAGFDLAGLGIRALLSSDLSRATRNLVPLAAGPAAGGDLVECARSG